MASKTKEEMEKFEDVISGLPENEPCQISVRVFPLVFFGKTWTLEFKLLFNSTCLEKPLLIYFLVPWDLSKGLFLEDHPTFVNLFLFN